MNHFYHRDLEEEMPAEDMTEVLRRARLRWWKKVAEWCYLNLVKWQESIRIRALKIYSMIGCTYVQQQRRKTLEQKFPSRKIDDLSQWLSNYWQV